MGSKGFDHSHQNAILGYLPFRRKAPYLRHLGRAGKRDSLRAGKSYRSEYVCCERSIRIHVLRGNGIGNYYRKDSQIITNPRRQPTPHGFIRRNAVKKRSWMQKSDSAPGISGKFHFPLDNSPEIGYNGGRVRLVYRGDHLRLMRGEGKQEWQR